MSLQPTGRRAARKIKVAAVVFNLAATDVRVVKEAESLFAAGYDVRIFGLAEEATNSRTPAGIPVTVLPRKVLDRRKLVMAILTLLGAVLAAVFLNGLLTGFELALILSFGGLAALVYLQRSTALRLSLSALLVAVAIAGASGLTLLGSHLPLFSHVIPKYASAPLFSGFVWTGNVVFGLIALLALRFIYFTAFVVRRADGEELADYAEETRSEWGRRLRTKAFVSAIRDFAPDIVHCHDLPTVPIGCKLKRLLRCKVIYDSHELWVEQGGLTPMRKKRDARLEQRILRQVDGVVTVNDSIAVELRSRYPFMPAPVVVRNATKPLSTPLIYDGRLHRRAGLPLNRRILLFQGGFAAGRGLEVLVEAAIDLPPNWTVVFMGWAKLEEPLKRLAAQILEQSNQSPDRICFLPPVIQRHLPAWTAGASVGIIPYENISLNNWFCSPNKLWEYPVAGVPILASPFPEMSKIIEEHRIGWTLSDPLTSESIAERIWALTPDALERARANCQAFIAADNWSIYQDRLLVLYGRVASGLGPEPRLEPLPAE